MKIWSVSKRRWLELSEMNGAHLENAHMRFLAGHYRLPVDDADPLVVREQTQAERTELADAFAAEFARRQANQ
jgi:hypothetical protein